MTRVLEGVSATTHIFEKAMATRVRPYARAFYGSGRVLKAYIKEDAMLQSLLKHMKHKVRAALFGHWPLALFSLAWC